MWFRKKQSEKMVIMQTQNPRPMENLKPMKELVKVFQFTEQGNREYQQDAVYTSVKGAVRLSSNKTIRVLGAVCDGMGGMEDGGKASSKAIEMLRDDFAKIKDDPKASIPNFLLDEVRRMDYVIHNFPGSSGLGSGTTIVAVVVENGHLHWISAGDSRIYLLRKGILQQVTRDHNYQLQLDQMVKSGRITQQQADAQRGKEALISFLGIGDIKLVDRSTFQLEWGDVLLLCSDGITKTIGDDQIRGILLSPTSSGDKKAQVLVQAAVRANTRSQDNTSAIILEYVKEP